MSLSIRGLNSRARNFPIAAPEKRHVIARRKLLLFGERRFGLWGARPHEASNLIGFGGLWPFHQPPELELPYGVGEHFWGQGYATEIAQAVTIYCFRSLAMLALRASTDVANVASIRVLEKLGFRFVRHDVVGGLNTVFYELARHAV